MKHLLTAFTAALFYCSATYSQPAVNEIMYAPTESNNEWFELTGISGTTDLKNWKWKDATSAIRLITAQNFVLEKDSFVVICQDSVRFRIQFPAFTGRLIQTQWSAMNNSGDNVILINAEGTRIDSVSYASSWGGNSGGYSLEKKIPSGPSIVPANWGTCADPSRGTPGRENSIRTKDHDLSIKRFETDPVNPLSGGSVLLRAVVENSGANPAEGASVNMFDDLNLDSVPQLNELLRMFQIPRIEPRDSATFETVLDALQPGTKQLIALVIFIEDQDSSDNMLVRSVIVSHPGQANNIIINEVMYEPLAGLAEWVELYNPTLNEYDLKKWSFRDNSNSIKISDSSLVMAPKSYLILASDSSVLNTYSYLKEPGLQDKVLTLQSLNLNNGGELISILDSLLATKDRLSYSPSMHNPDIEDKRGVSLERINPALPADYPGNWSSSADPLGGTPGKKNSIYAESVIAESGLKISPNPFSPDGDGSDDVAVISCSFGFTGGTIRANIYDIRGRMVRTLANNEITGSEKTFLFNGYSDSNEKLNVGIYIVLVEAIDRVRGVPVTVKAPLVIAAKL